MKKFLFLVVSVSLFAFYSCQKPQENKKPYLIMLSLDGFRWDYPVYARTPVLDSLQKAGVIAESLKPSFPTKTFPNHYTIATGLYPDHNGMVNNSFYAPGLKKFYRISDREAVENGAFYGGEPIWVTAEKQNVRSATFFWVGSEAKIEGIRPDYWYRYDKSVPFKSRVDSVKHWLSLPENERPHLILWYYYQPDHIGHKEGPYSRKTIAMVEKLDSLLGYYFTQMRKLPEFRKLNFIITSDHGMTEISNDRVVLLNQYVDTADIDIIMGGNPNFNIKVKPGKLEKVYRQLKNTPHIFAWKHDSVPQRLHYGHNPRTLDIIVVPYPGWSVLSGKKRKVGNGSHGYDNDFKDMHAIFYAAGPAFKKGFVHPTFENVNIYPLIAKIMNLKPAPVDGKLENVETMLVVKN